MDSTNHDLPGAGTPGELAGADEAQEARRGPLGWSIFDPEFKWLASAPPHLIIMAVNGLFGTNFKLHAEVRVDFGEDVLGLFALKLLGGVFLTITEIDPDTGEENLHTFVVQLVPHQDFALSFRGFQYAYKETLMSPESGVVANQFKTALELVLYEGAQEQKENKIGIVCNDGMIFPSPILVMRFLQQDFGVNAEQLLPLLPFEVLRYRDELKENASEERVEKLKNHIGAIDRSLADAHKRLLLNSYEVETLRGLMIRLYNDAYDFLAQKGVRLLPAVPPAIPENIKFVQSLSDEIDMLARSADSIVGHYKREAQKPAAASDPAAGG